MINVSVLGATGYTGFELVKILLGHTKVKLTNLTSSTLAGKAYADLFPALDGIIDLILKDNDLDVVAEQSDAVFLCLPHGASMDAAAYLSAKGVKVFDLSADYRIKNTDIYRAAYGIEHRHTAVLSKAVYGLAEIYEEQIAKANLVAVPGCYPTSILIPLIPLLKEGLIDAEFIISDSKSGVSGAGKKATETTHFCEANEDFKPYGIFSHRHKPEIDHIIEEASGKKTDIIFTPHLAPFNRGMLSTIYLKSKADLEKLYGAWSKAYSSKPFVRIKRSTPRVHSVAGTAFVDIALFKEGEKVIVVSALDNLMKGASSQAVQCFNINFGLPHTAGLI